MIPHELKDLKIPFEVVKSKQITPGCKFFYGLLIALSDKKGYCDLKNKELAEILDCHQVTLEQWSGELEKHGYIKKTYKNKAKAGKKIFPIHVDKKMD